MPIIYRKPGLLRAGSATSEYRTSCAQPPVVLYIDDQPASIRLVYKALQKRGNCALIGAGTGREGVHLARTAGPELKAILVDINLPDISGYEVLRACRKNPSTRSLPIIAVSASAMKHEVRKGLDAGFDHYLTKPLDIATLIGFIDEAIDFSHQQSRKE